jgi:UV DNA damage endonuclease
MKIGYPCINTQIGCKSDSRFRLSSYSEERIIEASSNNIQCLLRILKFNVQKDLYFFRISSDTIPFASHPICSFDWAYYFKEQFHEIGQIIQENNMRISMHPGQYVVLNSPKEDIVVQSIRELEYHTKLLESMGLDNTAKIQIHLGGVYGDKVEAMSRFSESYDSLKEEVRDRLVIENDERSYSLQDCIEISKKIGIPVVFDTLHHEYNNNNESFVEAMEVAGNTWKKSDGIQMIDYSNAENGSKLAKHSNSLDVNEFRKFIKETSNLDYDTMLEVKDKEKSALEAVKILREMGRI